MTYCNVDSKFRFVILASKRAKELLRGARPKLETKSKNPIRIAQIEVVQNLISYEITPLQKEEGIEHGEVYTREKAEQKIEESIGEEAGEIEVEREDEGLVEEEEEEEKEKEEVEEEDEGEKNEDENRG